MGARKPWILVTQLCHGAWLSGLFCKCAPTPLPKRKDSEGWLLSGDKTEGTIRTRELYAPNPLGLGCTLPTRLSWVPLSPDLNFLGGALAWNPTLTQ